ncbi:MAG: hypothetical protein ACTHM0_13280 [Sphingomonas sp.]
MRFGRDKLIFMGLVALDEMLEQVRERPIEPSFAVRTVLAMLFAMSDGDRAVFNDFWRACQVKPDPRLTPNMEDVRRSSDARRALSGIRSSLGCPPAMSLGADIALARRDPGPHQRAYQALNVDARRSEAERRRKEFAEWLLSTDGLGDDDPAPIGDQLGVSRGVSPADVSPESG